MALYRTMKFIRAVEEEIARRYPEGKMRCPTHLSIGQEAVPGVFSLLVRKDDYAVSTHRGHAHYLAKGGNLNAMIAEIYGKVTGCSKGKGGSMHLADKRVNFMGTSAIVGNSIPVGVGLGLASQLQGTDQISCIFLGDGAVEEGVFYESVNFAAVRQLPVVFICENNLYSVYSNLSVRQPKGRVIADMVSGIGATSWSADGADLDATYSALGSAMAAARSGKGPQFIEIATYRWREHCGCYFDNDIGYRTVEEYKKSVTVDPLNNLMQQLLSDEKVSKEIKSLNQEIDKLIFRSFEQAELDPYPDPETAFQGVYAA